VLLARPALKLFDRFIALREAIDAAPYRADSWLFGYATPKR
jgi:hypothetical protein